MEDIFLSQKYRTNGETQLMLDWRLTALAQIQSLNLRAIVYIKQMWKKVIDCEENLSKEWTRETGVLVGIQPQERDRRGRET